MRLDHLALPTLGAFVVAAGLLFDGFNSAAGEAVSAILAALLLAATLLLKQPQPRFWSGMLWPLGLVVLAFAWLALVRFGITPGPGMPRPVNYAPDLFDAKLVGLIGGVAMLASGVLIATDRWQTRRVTDLLILLACATFLFGLVLRAVGTEGALSYWDVVRRGRFAGTMGNINVTAAGAAAVALMAFSCLLGDMQAQDRTKWRSRSALAAPLFHGTCFVIAVGTVLATAARFPLVVLAAMLVLLGGLGVVRRARKRTHIVTMLSIAAIVAALFLGFSGLIIERFGALDAEYRVRMTMWTHYAELAKVSALYGYGPGAFASVNVRSLTDPQLAQTLWFVNSAHNVVLQILLVGGVPYFLLLGSAALVVGGQIIAYLFRRPRGIEDWGLLAAIMSIFVCSLVDIVLDVRATVSLTLFLAGLLWGRALPFNRRSHAAVRVANAVQRDNRRATHARQQRQWE